MSTIPGNQCSEDYSFTPCSALRSDLEKGVIIVSLSSVEYNCKMVINLRGPIMLPGSHTVYTRSIYSPSLLEDCFHIFHQTFLNLSPSVLLDDNFVCYFTDEKEIEKFSMCSDTYELT